MLGLFHFGRMTAVSETHVDYGQCLTKVSAIADYFAGLKSVK